MSDIIVPPIKSQGIKTKLIPWINDLIFKSGIDFDANWIEPFFGTGVVGFNSPIRGSHIVGDTNPHIINFYSNVQEGLITKYTMRSYLENVDKCLSTSDENGYSFYRQIRDRFNIEHNSYDFIFLSRAGFNGMMRFNKKGEWNIPFCKKPNRFAPAYITKICNQIESVSRIIKRYTWEFNNVSFIETIERANSNDIIYCDPPYYGRYTDYYNGWTEKDEIELFEALKRTRAKFILSTWHHNDYRENDMLNRFWRNFNVTTKEHFYHGGGKIENRHAMTEALVFNFEIKERSTVHLISEPTLFDFAQISTF